MINTLINTAVASGFTPRMIDLPKFSPNHRIKTKRLFMRPVSEADLCEYVALFSDKDVMRFVGIKAGDIPSHKEIKQLHHSTVQAWKSRGYGRWSLFDKFTNEFVGLCGFRAEEGNPELICAMHKNFWGRGLAKEASNACLRYGFEAFHFKEVRAFTRPDHNRARRVMDKLGARFFGLVQFHGVEGASYSLSPESKVF